MVVRSFIFGLVTGAFLVGCVSASLGYRYYGLEGNAYEGKLLGPKAEDDRDFSECKPDDQIKGKCVILFAPEFKALASELLGCRQSLIDCEKNCQCEKM